MKVLDERRHTRMLALLVAAASAAVWVGASRLSDARAAAAAADADLRVVRADLLDLAAAGGAEPAGAAGKGDVDPDLNRRIRAAADAAGLGAQLVSIEPRDPRPIEGSPDRGEALLFLHFDRATLRGVVHFLGRLSADAAFVRSAGIELSAAEADAAATGSETWSADLTLSYEVRLSPKGSRGTPE